MDACGRIISMFLIAACAGGCSFIDRHAAAASKSPLERANPSLDSVTLEIFSARGPLGNDAFNTRLWKEIDEQRIPAEVRVKLAESGFRAGIVGGHVPDELAKLLTLTDKPNPKSDEPAPINLEEEPGVTMRLLQARAGKRNEVVCSGQYAELPLLVSKGKDVTGQTYLQADGRFALKSYPDTTNRVQLDLVPEVHHGEQQARWVGGDGIMRLEPGKRREVFDDLRIRVALAPGEMLLMTTLPERPGSLGHYFFTQPTSERTSQKLLVIRVAHGGGDALFGNEPAEVAEVDIGD
jgi:hypothetical protein